MLFRSTGSKKSKYKAWVCRDRQLGRKGNGCQMRIVKEDDLFAEICRQMGWGEVTEEKIGEVERIVVTDDGVEITKAR